MAQTTKTNRYFTKNSRAAVAIIVLLYLEGQISSMKSLDSATKFHSPSLSTAAGHHLPLLYDPACLFLGGKPIFPEAHIPLRVLPLLGLAPEEARIFCPLGFHSCSKRQPFSLLRFISCYMLSKMQRHVDDMTIGSVIGDEKLDRPSADRSGSSMEAKDR